MDVRRCAIAGVAALLPFAAGAQPGSQTTVYRVDAAASDVHWRVYKAGAFARLGHNHVISVAGLAGNVELAADGTACWSLGFDVGDLVVDEPALRDLYGEDFASEPSDEDIAGTKRNMLSETVLDGEHFHSITVSGNGYTGSLDAAELQIRVEMLGRSIDLTVPGSVTIDGDTLTAEGEFTLQHSDLGMEPFSVMMGALKVAPQIDFTYRIHAVTGDR